jgi:hypothetical protein
VCGASKLCSAGIGAGACKPAGATCTGSTECCNLTCIGGVCGATACLPDNANPPAACTSGAQCCSGVCTNSVCARAVGANDAGGTCAIAGDLCTATGDGGYSDQCCSKLCTNGRCQIASSFCVQNGDICTSNGQCCGGICSIATGATVGLCTQPPASASNCGGVDGTVCNGCTGCCSRVCAPFITGISICQPANGCHVEGDLCAKDSDCCGGEACGPPDAGIPGAGTVICEGATTTTPGICRSPQGGGPCQPQSCRPEGETCHFKNGAATCGPSSASADNCCDYLGSKSDCEVDPLGVPRCRVIGSDGGLACRGAGQLCADSLDCCNGVPCVPDGAGNLVCCSSCVPSDAGGKPCVPVSGGCTTNGDCCNGGYCNVPPGSTQGTCNAVPTVTPPDSGVTTLPDGAVVAPDGAIIDDAAALPDSPIGSGGGSCSLYGQGCAQASDCCNGVPCTDIAGNNCASEMGCSCVFPVH